MNLEAMHIYCCDRKCHFCVWACNYHRHLRVCLIKSNLDFLCASFDDCKTRCIFIKRGSTHKRDIAKESSFGMNNDLVKEIHDTSENAVRAEGCRSCW